jgi:cytochrome c-type biogenesis protein CcmE
MPTSLDRELEKALDGAQEGAPARSAPPKQPRSSVPDPQPVTISAAQSTGPGGRRGVGFLVVLLTMGVGILMLVMTSFKNAAVYAKHVDEVVAARAELAGRRLRVEGMLVHGTLERRDSPCEYRFQMERNGATLLVHYAQCVVPDTFRDVPGVEVGVTVEGKLASNGDFQATQVMAKCPSKYEQRKSGGSATNAAQTMPAL